MEKEEDWSRLCVGSVERRRCCCDGFTYGDCVCCCSRANIGMWKRNKRDTNWNKRFFLGIISKWHLFGGFCCFFLFSVNLYQMLYSGLFVWRGLTACSPFYKTIVLNFSQTRSEDHSGFSSPLFSPGGGALVEIKSDFPFFFSPDFFKNPRHQCCRGVVAECCLDITVNPAALGLKEIS